MSVTLDPPLLRVLRGEPDADQLAALLAVVTSRAASPVARRPASVSTWADPARRLRPPMRPGPGAWRRSGLPR